MSRINSDARIVAEAEARVYISGQGTGGNPSSSPEKSAVVGSVDEDGTIKAAGILGITPLDGPFYLAGSY
jgi:hypothetical protein